MRGVGAPDSTISPDRTSGISLFDKDPDEPVKVTKTMIREMKNKKKEDKEIKERQLKMKEERHSKVFLR